MVLKGFEFQNFEDRIRRRLDEGGKGGTASISIIRWFRLDLHSSHRWSRLSGFAWTCMRERRITSPQPICCIAPLPRGKTTNFGKSSGLVTWECSRQADKAY